MSVSPGSGRPLGGVIGAKAKLRQQVMTRRRFRAAGELSRAGAANAERLLALPDLAAARTVAVYVSMGLEPPTDLVLSTMLGRGLRVLLPVLQPDRELDWVIYGGPPTVLRSGRGTPQILGDKLGLDAIHNADIVVCPGLAADRAGNRLGRGGGSYDRTLARARDDSLKVVLLFDDEVLDEVPRDSHDQRVDLLITPSQTLPRV